MADNADGEGVIDPVIKNEEMAGNPEPPEPAPEQEANETNQAIAGGPVGGVIAKPAVAFEGNSGQGCTPNVINVFAGEDETGDTQFSRVDARLLDVVNKIMGLMQQTNRNICILSAFGSISNACICQPATSGGNITYEGRFDIISLSGSYVRTDQGGKTGGLSVCLSNTHGQIIGGEVGGPLKAAGLVQVIVGTYLIDNRKDVNAGVKVEAPVLRTSSPGGGASMMNESFHPAADSSGRMVGGNDEQQPMAYELAGRGLKSENGDYDQIPDIERLNLS